MADRSLEILIQLQANTAAAAQVQGALKDMTQSATLAARALEQAFSPRLVQSQQQLAAQMFQGGKAIANFATEVEFLKGVGVGTTQSLNALSAEMIRLSTAGNITSKTMEELIAQSQAIWAQNNLVASGLNQVTSGLKAQSAGLETVNAGLGSMTPNATAAQKAGQGLILSFSLSQAMAGNFAQSLFGLGFSLLFVGPQMLNVITIATALGAALGGIAIEQLTAHFKNETVPVLQQVSDRMKDIRDAIADVRGEEEELVRALEGLVEAEGATDTLAGTTAELSAKMDELRGAALRVANAWLTGNESMRQVKELQGELGLNSDEVRAIMVKLQEQGSVTLADFISALIQASDHTQELQANVAAAGDAITRSFGNAAAAVRDMVAAQAQGVADTAADAARAAPFDAIRSELTRNFQIQQEQSSAASQAGNAAASQARQDRTRMLRRALDDELQVHRDHIDRIKEALSDRVEVIRDASDTEIRLIRERVEAVVVIERRALQDSLDDMKQNADDRIDAVKDAAKRELDINKERIDSLKDQERDLVEALRDLTRRRQEGIRDILQAEEEIAELEALQRQQGVDPSIELELALREARLRALNEEQDSLEDQVDVNEDQVKGIKELIEAEEERGEQIKKNRDDAIDAIKDVLQEAQKAARRRSEDDIRAINRTRDAEIRAAKDAADAKIAADQDASDRRIASINAQMERIRRASEDEIAGIQAAARTSAAASNAQRRADRDALAAQMRYVDLIEEKANRDAAYAKFLRDELLPALQALIEGFAGNFIDLILNAKAQGFSPETLLQLAEILIPQGVNPFQSPEELLGMQTGGTVPGAVGEPQLAMLHGGERVESGQTMPHERDTVFPQEQVVPAGGTQQKDEITRLHISLLRDLLDMLEKPEEHRDGELDADAIRSFRREDDRRSADMMRASQQEEIRDANRERRVDASRVLKVILESTGNSISPSELRKLKSKLNRSFGQDIEVHLRSRRLLTG